jgi:hypothetical protein
VLFAQRLQTGPVPLRQSGSVLDLVIAHADVFILREATRQSGASISAAFDGCGSTLFAPGRSALDFACAQKWLLNSFALPLNVRILRFWRIALGGGISMTPARRNCRARSRTRIGYSTPFIDSSFPVGIEPFEWGAELRRGDWGVGCCGGDSDVLGCWSDPGHDGRRLAPLESPERETPLPQLIMQDARSFLASR